MIAWQMALDMRDIERRIVLKNLRLTRQRCAILTTIADAHCSPILVQPNDATRARYLDIGLPSRYRPTVYRAYAAAAARWSGYRITEHFLQLSSLYAARRIASAPDD
jgi:hypothetical protein